MLAVSEAQAIVLHHARPLSPIDAPLTGDALGLVLAEDVASDLDMPPFDKALMDGYAVRAADLTHIGGSLAVIEEVTAGCTPKRIVGPGQATRIMTGAPMPDGADAVVMVERTRVLDDKQVRLEETARAGQNVLARGEEMRRGQTVLSAGAILRPQEFGVLASVGRTTIKVYPRPRVALLATGDELVEASQVPGPGQIRNSNGPMLAAQVLRAGGIPHALGIGRDRVDHLRGLIAEGLRAPILLLSGGVSAGKLDLVPGVLQELGVQPHFHSVKLKPGKPLLFGTVDGALVFGLPGNPVSSLVCFELFVRPAIRELAGHADPGPIELRALLTEDFPYRSDRPTYHPAWLEYRENGWSVRPVPWFGSPDLRGLTRANSFVILPAGDHLHRAGKPMSVLKVED
jgi:molybdopterin molybdotransferase